MFRREVGQSSQILIVCLSTKKKEEEKMADDMAKGASENGDNNIPEDANERE